MQDFGLILERPRNSKRQIAKARDVDLPVKMISKLPIKINRKVNRICFCLVIIDINPPAKKKHRKIDN